MGAERDAPQEDSVPLGLLTDPHGVLEAVARADEFFHGPDNHVEYRALSAIEGVKKYIEFDPGRFRVGDIVEIQASFVCIPVANARFKMMPIMRALTQLDKTFQQAAMVSRLQAASAHTTKQQTTLKTLKRKKAYTKEDEDVENARSSLGDLQIGDRDINMN
ncbi:hypothetical protein DXG01_013662 [Tephrocybe rancida]|nr:hypothetical protein DXG01_013662 [Tephrocybe rancida]